MRRWVFVAFGVCVAFNSFLFLPPAACQTQAGADSFLIAQQEALAKNPSGLDFTIRLKDNKDHFQQGEIIRIELSFSSTLPKTYQLDGGLYDRSGRLEIDSYRLDPTDGVVDPLKDWPPGLFGGGLRSMPILDVKPYLIVRDLNEYVRFDKPGKYRLYVVSNRIWNEPSEEERRQTGLVHVPATSNIIEFTILPLNRKWARKQLPSAEAILNSPGSPDFMQRDEEVGSATRTIRYLGTEDSVRYMVRHLDEAEADFGYGLIGSPFPAIVVKEMESGLAAPDCAVTGWYLWILEFRSYVQKYSRWFLPYPGAEDKARLDQWQQEEAKAQVARKAIRDDYLNRLAAAIDEKKGRTKAVCLNTLLNAASQGPKGAQPPLSAEFIEKLPSQLIHAFFDLPVQTQYSLLEYQWDRIKNPEMMPVLERYCENPPEEKGVFNLTAVDAALKRLFEMDPKRGREQILRQIMHPTGRIRFEILAMLPDRTLPEMDNLFASGLEASRNDHHEQLRMQAQLLARYGTRSILLRIKAALLENDNLRYCDIRAPIIAYLLRVDPAFGVAELEYTLSPKDRARTGYCHVMPSNVARFYFSSELQAVVTRHLDDPDSSVVRDCVETLGRYGSAQAEAPLWRRFEKWHDEWKEKANELQKTRIGFNPQLDVPRSMEMAFGNALATAQAWLADAEKLKRIQSLCLTENERQQVGFFISEAEAPKKRISFMPGPGDSWSFQVAQYRDLASLDAVKSKLAQFPKGTVFICYPFNHGQAEEQKKALFVELRAFLEQLGMSLEEPQFPN